MDAEHLLRPGGEITQDKQTIQTQTKEKKGELV